MSGFFDLVTRLQSAVDSLTALLSGSDTTTVLIGGVSKPSVSKAIADKYAELQALLRGRVGYQTKALLDAAGAPADSELAEVWNDSVLENNGWYGWTGVVWEKSKHDTIINKVVKGNTSSPVSGDAIWQLQELVSESKNRFDLDAVVSGYLPVVAPFDGQLFDVSGVAKTSDFIWVGDLQVGESLYINGLGSVAWGRSYVYYDKDKNVIDDSFNQVVQDSSQETIVGRKTQATQFIRITVATTKAGDNTDLSLVAVSSLDYLSVYEAFAPILTRFFGNPLSAEYAVNEPVDPFHVVNKKFVDDNLMYSTPESLGLINSPENLFYLPEVVEGYLPVVGAMDGVVIANSTYKTSGFFSIDHLAVGVDSLYFSGFSGSYSRFIYFYDADLNPVLNPGNSPHAYYRQINPIVDTFVDVEVDQFRPVVEAVYARLTVETAPADDVTDLNLVQITGVPLLAFVPGTKVVSKVTDRKIAADTCLKSALSDYDIINLGELKKRMAAAEYGGRNLAVLGDSITAGSTNWPKYASGILGVSVQNHAVSGGHWEDFGADPEDSRWLRHQVTALLASGVVPDVVVIAMGTNSLNEVWGDFDATLAADFNSLDTTTIYGGMRSGLERIRQAYPGVPFYLCNPLQRASVAPNHSTFVAMVDGIERMASWYGCEVFSCDSELGILHQMEKDSVVFLHDGLHTNDAGAELQGRYVASKISAALSFY